MVMVTLIEVLQCNCNVINYMVKKKSNGNGNSN